MAEPVIFKVIVVGEMGVGKTSLMLRYCEKTYSDNPIHTVGVSSRHRTLDVDGLTVKLMIWDTAGQERYRTLTSGFYRGATGIVIMYDVTNLDSFNTLSRWLRDVDEHSTEDVGKIIVGNKIDLTAARRAVAKEKGKQFAEHHQCEYAEISCRDNTNIDESFILLARRMKANIDKKSTLTRQKDIALMTAKNKNSVKCPC